jgi:hypothetical protein
VEIEGKLTGRLRVGVNLVGDGERQAIVRRVGTLPVGVLRLRVLQSRRKESRSTSLVCRRRALDLAWEIPWMKALKTKLKDGENLVGDGGRQVIARRVGTLQAGAL